MTEKRGGRVEERLLITAPTASKDTRLPSRGMIQGKQEDTEVKWAFRRFYVSSSHPYLNQPAMEMADHF